MRLLNTVVGKQWMGTIYKEILSESRETPSLLFPLQN